MDHRPAAPEAPAQLPPEQVERVRALLARILSSRPFHGSRRCQSLLRYITEQTLNGDIQSLKERTLGVEVFGREPDYDTAHDPVVRASAAEIRKKLAQYYQEPGNETGDHIDLLPGSYVAEFHLNGAPTPLVKPSPKRLLLVSVCGAAAVLAILSAALLLTHPKRAGFAQLWSPLLDAPGSVLICVGQPIVYNLKSTYEQDRIQGIVPGHPPTNMDSGDLINKRDLLIFGDRYVDLGDAICLAHLASYLDSHHKPFRIRGERSTSFADLSDGPSVLIGAFNNQWTMRASEQLRYTFYKDSVNEIDVVRDRQHPDNTTWKLTQAWPEWDVPVDYAIISRFFDNRTNRPVVIAAGMTHHGTMAAGDFLVNPEYFAEAEGHLTPGWQKRNLQIVLSVPVVNRHAGRPTIVAAYSW